VRQNMPEISLSQFLKDYGDILTKKAIEKLNPAYNPAKEDDFDREVERRCNGLLRKLFPAQLSAVKAAVKGLFKENLKNIFFVGEMGTGKTIEALAAIYASPVRNSRTLIVCPPHLVEKWIREIEMTIAEAEVFNLNGKDVIRKLLKFEKLHRKKIKPQKPQFFVIGRERVKLRYGWRPAFIKRKISEKKGLPESILYCPDCFRPLFAEDDDILTEEQLKKKKYFCPNCRGALFCADRTRRRHEEPAWFIKKRLKGFFDFAVFDEAHEFKGQNTNQGNAFGSIASAVKKTLCLTGTLMGGYAEDLFYLLYRTAPQKLKDDFTYRYGTAAFTARYGVLERAIIEKNDEDKKFGRGGKQYTRIRKKPGVSPEILTKYLFECSIFMRLADVAQYLPPYTEHIVTVEMDKPLKETYGLFEKQLKDAISSAYKSRSTRLLSSYLHALLVYPDRCRKEIAIYEDENLIALAPALELEVTAKEKKLIEIIEREKSRGRNCLIYCTYTGKYDVAEDIKNLLQKSGISTFILKQTIPPEKRERWIKEKLSGLSQHAVMICNSELVKTGLDLIYFPTVIFYQTGYSIYTLRQASRRSWRIGQNKPVSVYYLIYEHTMQHRAMKLIASKLQTSLAIEGELTDNGLSCLSEAGESLTYELAKSLLQGMKDGDALETLWSGYLNTEREMDSHLLPEEENLHVEIICKGHPGRRKRSVLRIHATEKELRDILKKNNSACIQMLLPLH